MEPAFPTVTVTQAQIRDALKAWHKVGGTPRTYLDSLYLVQLARQQKAPNGSPVELRLATNQVLLDAIDEMAEHQANLTRLLRLRYLEDKTQMEMANLLNISRSTYNRQQDQALDDLTKIVNARERRCREMRIHEIESQLPPSTYTHLFGVEDSAETLHATLLNEPERPGVVAITGIGGIGKSALADHVVRRLVGEFVYEDVLFYRVEPATMSSNALSPEATFDALLDGLTQRLWGEEATAITAESRLPRLRAELKAHPYLVVVDNLESSSDSVFLADHLNDLAHPSQFLLTSRTRLSAESAVINVAVDKLSRNDAEALLHHHGRELGIAKIDTLQADSIDAIFDLVGGNPLALKLVVSLLDLVPLAEILTTLRRGHAGQIEEMYKRIYWTAWNLLSKQAQSLLKAMPLAAESGENTAYLQQLSGLSDAAFWPALQELRHRSLLEVRGTLQEKQYGIHRLTETFVQTEIVDFAEDALPPSGDEEA